MKRLIRTSFSALLALILALGIGVSAMASSGPPPGFEGPQGASRQTPRPALTLLSPSSAARTASLSRW